MAQLACNHSLTGVRLVLMIVRSNLSASAAAKALLRPESRCSGGTSIINSAISIRLDGMNPSSCTIAEVDGRLSRSNFSSASSATVADFSHVNNAARRGPNSRNSFSTEGLARMRSIARPISTMLAGSGARSDRPTTSGMLVFDEPTTGAPQAIASNSGRPKPSLKDGKANVLL